MNKVLVSLGYNANMILPDDADAGIVIAALSRGTMVESHGYGKDEKFTPQESTFSVRRIDASRLVMDEDGKARIEADELRSRLESTQRVLVDTQKKLEALKAQSAVTA